MDIFTKFNRASIDDRQVDTLIGLSKGLFAAGKIDPSEADFFVYDTAAVSGVVRQG